MTTNRNIFNEVVFECDECGKELDTNCRDFDAALQQMRESGWKARRVEEYGWTHACASCQQEPAFGKVAR